MQRWRDHILWCHGQIANAELRDERIRAQIEIWKTWLAANLRARDLVVVGFWSDWFYLNDILSHVLSGIDTGHIYLIDPAPLEELRAKAPGLCEVAERNGGLHHIPESGALFLDVLRKRFSIVFLRSADRGIGALLVLSEGKLVGILSERDYARKVILQNRSSRLTFVEEIMTSPVLVAKPNQSVSDCMVMMTEKRIRHLPVVENETILGIVSIGDIVKWIVDEQEHTIELLHHYIANEYPS